MVVYLRPLLLLSFVCCLAVSDKSSEQHLSLIYFILIFAKLLFSFLLNLNTRHCNFSASQKYESTMHIPTYGALPLSETFLCVRGLSLIAMVGIVGITANFVVEINASGLEPPKEIVGTLSIVCPLAQTLKWSASCILTRKNTDLHRNPLHANQHSILLSSSKSGLVRHDGNRLSSFTRLCGRFGHTG
jgi:hypothetical protein